ncbi:uncharacterized protein LOC142179386 [Nicotiana tabacum]|uniref:Uncharacterized protein LOC142179386 n=2 Tax=Nicotiana TaxID=4085 RepID=A0AC58U712_TOBAC|nr:PREDICTED: uncharacterized protein LOC104215331 [Nicotiana sylvestris]
MKMQAAVAALAVVLQEWKVFELRNGYEVKLRAIQGIGYTFSGVIEVVELVACHRLHHGLGDALIYGILLNKYGFVGQVITKHNLIMRQSSNLDRKDHGYSWLIAGAMEIFSGESASKTVYQFFKVDNSSFDGCEHVKELAQESMVISLIMHTCTEVEFENISSIASSGVNNRAIIIVGKGNIVLVSDENGTTKTGTTTVLMCYLACFGGHRTIERRAVEQQVLELYPVLDALGSTKTVINTNSNHRSEFVEIQFVRNGRTTDEAPKGHPESFHHLSHLKFYELLAVGVARNTFETRMAWY